MTDKEFKYCKDVILSEITEYYQTPYEYILRWIKTHCKNHTWSIFDKDSWGNNTYGLKHSIERDYITKELAAENSHGYCANNWAKLALYELGFCLYNKNDIKLHIDSPFTVLEDIKWSWDYQFNNITERDMLDNRINYIYKLPNGTNFTI